MYIIDLMAIISILLFISAVAESSVVLQDNGYTNIVVAISEDIVQPQDHGFAMIESLKELLTETSSILLVATNYTMYMKDIKILVPSTWNVNASIMTTTEDSFELADIRVTKASNSSYGSLPNTLHSGKCGVAGNFITLPIDYVIDENDNTTVEAKATVQQWAQYRYGVFEEHGYPNDKVLPYFYRHPDGYDAITSSNNTIVKGDLISSSGGVCQIDENGLISNQSECRFIPSTTGQSATSSLMSFHWLDSVIGFSEKDTHDKRPPHRQNRLCSSRSSSEIIFQSPDLIYNEPKPEQNPLPEFRLFQNKMLPVLYLAIDKSKPSSPNNAGESGLQILTRSLNALFVSLESNHPDVYVAWSTFENTDSGDGIYLKEEIAPIRFEDGKEMLQSQLNNLTFSENVLSRDVSAVLRDAEPRLRQYKNVGGSILYIITSTESVTKDTVLETDLADKFLLNNIKLVVAESGPGNQALSRFSIMSEGSYYYKISWGTTAFFTPINTEIDYLCANGIKSQRRTIISKKDSLSTSDPWTGSFSIDETIGKNTTVVLQSPIQGSFTVTIDSPSGEQLILENDNRTRNWNYSYSTVGVNWLPLIDLAEVGEWNYTVSYNSSTCSTCETVSDIHLQVSSSIRRGAGSDLPKFKSWISLTPGFDYVDMSQHPAIIQVRFDSKAGRLGGLTVTADLIQNSVVVESIPLTDTGTFDTDISNDGIYSAIFYPENDGNYTVNLYALQANDGVYEKKRMMMNDQNSFCCGSSLPTVNLKYFQSTFIEAITFEVRNSSVPSQESTTIIIDFQASTYGMDKGNVYVLLSWTVPFDTQSQIVRYSEDYNQLLNEFDQAPEATVVYGSLDIFEAGAPIEIYVSSPYTEGINVYFVVETTTAKDRKSRSSLVWTEPYPPENPFIPPSTTQGPAVTTEETVSTTEVTTTEESTITTTTSEDTTSVTTEQDITTTFTTEEIVTTISTTGQEITSTIMTTQEDTSVTTTPQESSVTTTPQDQSTSVITTEDTSSSTNDLPDTTVNPTTPPNKLSSAEIGYIVGGVILFICIVVGVLLHYKKKRDGRPSVNMDFESNSGGNDKRTETILPRVPLTVTEIKPIEIQPPGEQEQARKSLSEMGSNDVNSSANWSSKDDKQDTNDLIPQSSSMESNIVDITKVALRKEAKPEIKDPTHKGNKNTNILVISERYSQKLLKSGSTNSLLPTGENVPVNNIDVNTSQ